MKAYKVSGTDIDQTAFGVASAWYWNNTHWVFQHGQGMWSEDETSNFFGLMLDSHLLWTAQIRSKSTNYLSKDDWRVGSDAFYTLDHEKN